LRDCIIYNDVAGVKALLQSNANANGWFSHHSILGLAAHSNMPQLIDLLVEHKADVDIVCGLNNTPLLSASIWGDNESVACLLKHKANVAAHANNSVSPLKAAIINNRLSTTSILLDGGADMEATENTDMTALTYAINKADYSMVELLLQHKANVNSTSTKGGIAGMTPLFFAIAMCKDSNIIELLIQHNADVNVINYDEEPMLLYAAVLAEGEDVDNPSSALRILIDNKADVSYVSPADTITAFTYPKTDTRVYNFLMKHYQDRILEKLIPTISPPIPIAGGHVAIHELIAVYMGTPRKVDTLIPL